ncbi:MAG: phosphate acyltransferase PlsX [Chloroflexota bacterium]|nr:phosphate acyltransferase PlsX [Chloroflexota bacterium]
MRIVVDAMGTDNYPAPDVEGAVLAARDFSDPIIVVGDEAAIKRELAKHTTAGLPIEVVHASEVITMEDKPGTVGKAKPNSSMHVGMNLVKQGQADAFVSMGNTGAALSIALLHTLRRIRGVKRPALTAIPPFAGKQMVFTDVGANADCKPDWMAQFALMGSIYAQTTLGVKKPTVALLSNGEEEGKGNELIRQSAELIAALPVDFIGNVEPKDVLKGAADVVVMDGFVGNIFIKSLEAGTSALTQIIRQELMNSFLTKIGAALARPAFGRVRKQIDPFEIGGAPLLGIDGVVIIGHGRSNATAIRNGVRQARAAVQGKVIETIHTGMASLATSDES